MIERLCGRNHLCCIRRGFTCTKIAVPTWVSSANYLETDTVSCKERIGRGPEFDLDPSAPIFLRWVLFFARLEAHQAIADIHRATIRIDIAHTSNEVCRGRGRVDIEDQPPDPDDHDRMLQDRCGIIEHIGASL